jgi:hypothetical protein
LNDRTVVVDQVKGDQRGQLAVDEQVIRGQIGSPAEHVLCSLVIPAGL